MTHFEAIKALNDLAHDKFPIGGDGRDLMPIESFSILMSYHGELWNVLADDFQSGVISPDEYFTACETLIDEAIRAVRLIRYEREILKLSEATA